MDPPITLCAPVLSVAGSAHAFQLNADGTGSVHNSKNTGGVNPATMEVGAVDFGEEHISDLTFDPAGLTLAIPEPSRVLLTALGLAGVFLCRRR